jgi:Kef-type K+ transport system membrane component KefB
MRGVSVLLLFSGCLLLLLIGVEAVPRVSRQLRASDTRGASVTVVLALLGVVAGVSAVLVSAGWFAQNPVGS